MRTYQVRNAETKEVLSIGDLPSAALLHAQGGVDLEVREVRMATRESIVEVVIDGSSYDTSQHNVSVTVVDGYWYPVSAELYRILGEAAERKVIDTAEWMRAQLRKNNAE